MTLKVIEYPKCTTCRKAIKWLQEENVEFEKVHIVENTPSQEELTTYYKLSGLPLKKFFNTSGNKYKELGLKDKLADMSEEEQLKLLASDGMLIKRPIVTDGEKITLGFKESDFSETWK
ncbi:MAG: arsenate reductase family protein [Lysinibacillus sp.]